MNQRIASISIHRNYYRVDYDDEPADLPAMNIPEVMRRLPTLDKDAWVRVTVYSDRNHATLYSDLKDTPKNMEKKKAVMEPLH